MSSSQRTVHIVDDHDAWRESVAWLVEGAGLRAAGYPDAATFLNACPPPPGELLVLDLVLPDHDGVELLARLRADGINLRAVACTGFGTPALRRRAREAGFDAYLEKPVDDGLLLQCLAPGETAPPSGRAERHP